MAAPETLPKFESPPVIEVVCGLMFKPLDALLAPHLGLLWERLKLSGYSACHEVAPLAPAIEQFDESISGQIEFSETPPLPRIWFVRSDENGLVQVQRDRFLHNWKKVRTEDEYPHYAQVIGMFRDRIASFEEFLRDTGIGKIEPRQYEMTYVNHIPQGSGWTTLDDLRRVFPDLSWQSTQGRFLSGPEGVNFRMSFLLPRRSGRLHATIRSAVRRQDGLPILLFELTARGMAMDMWAWFDLAHEWIVRSFADLTGSEMHAREWKRIR